MAKLFPPNIEGTIPAFYGYQGAVLTVPFSMNKSVSKHKVKNFIIKIKSVQSNTYIATKYADSYSFDPSCEVSFYFTEQEMKKFKVGQYYKVQIAYVSEETDPITEETISVIGYYSTVGVVKYTTKPTVEIAGLENAGVNSHIYQYTGRYSQENRDTTEKAYSYCFNLYDSNGALLQTSGEQIHNNSHDVEYYESIDLYDIQQDLDVNKSYFLEYIVTTSNKMKVSSGTYRIMQKKSIDPEIRADLLTKLNYENGYVTINLQGHYNDEGLEYAATGAFRILRASDEDNFATWNEILKFALYGQQPSRWIWQDMTVKQGVTYQYALQQYNDHNLVSNRLTSEKIYVDFEHAFLYDGERQLKIKYNPKVASFKNDVLESKMDTIGAKFPYIFRNGNVKYKEFSISGLLSCQLDEEFLFVDEGSLNRFDNTSNLVSDNIATEREFKLEVLEWLNNGKPKLFRSPTEGNYIVRLLNVSMTPNDTLGRMLHTFTATAYEIAEHNYENLAAYGLINVGDPTVEQLRWETIKLDQAGIGAPGQNILNYKAVSLHFEGMIPGDKLYINDGIEREFAGEKILGYYVTIGVTGSYIIDLNIGATISQVWFVGSFDNQDVDNKIVQHQGTLTYAYYSRVQNRFDSITNITIDDVAMQQFIGRHDVLHEIEDIRVQIQGIYWLRAILRETATAYKRNDGYYYTSAIGNIKVDWDPLILYYVYNQVNNTEYWEDGYSHDTYAPEDYDSKIYFIKDPTLNNENGYNHNVNKGMDLKETYEYSIKNPKDITTLVTGNGVILELSYQKQTLDYNVETNGKYPKLTQLRQEMIEAYNYLLACITNENVSESEIKEARKRYDLAYAAYIIKLEKVLEEEEAAQGDIVSK